MDDFLSRCGGFFSVLKFMDRMEQTSPSEGAAPRALASAPNHRTWLTGLRLDLHTETADARKLTQIDLVDAKAFGKDMIL